MDAIETLLVMALAFFSVALALIVRICLAEDKARREAIKRSKVYDRNGAIRPLYVENIRRNG